MWSGFGAFGGFGIASSGTDLICAPADRSRLGFLHEAVKPKPLEAARDNMDCANDVNIDYTQI